MSILADHTTEGRMVSAVKAAAARITSGQAANLNQELATQLTNFNVPAGFAKEAACAANKGMSTAYLASHPDCEKPLDFELFDPEVVESLMSNGVSQETPQKGSSVHASITITPAATIEKKASAEPEQFQDNESIGSLYKKANCAFDRIGHALEECRYEIAKMDHQYTEALGYIKKTASYHQPELQYAIDVYGSALDGVLEDCGFQGLEKAAGIPVPVQDEPPFVRMVKRAALLRLLRDTAMDHNRDVMESLDPLVKTAQSLDSFLDADTMVKLATSPGIDAAAHLGTMAMGIPLGSLQGLVEGVSSGINNGIHMAQVGDKQDFSVDKVLDAEFLKQDRKIDRMRAWADVLADKSLAGYPADQLHKVLNRVMAVDPSMESPRNLELLKAHVRRALAQNDELSTADMAALLTTLGRRGQIPQHIYSGITGSASRPEYVSLLQDASKPTGAIAGGLTKMTGSIGTGSPGWNAFRFLDELKGKKDKGNETFIETERARYSDTMDQEAQNNDRPQQSAHQGSSARPGDNARPVNSIRLVSSVKQDDQARPGTSVKQDDPARAVIYVPEDQYHSVS